MKQTTLLLLLMLTSVMAFAQSSKRCWNFETQCPHPENSFFTLCIYDAHSASGSPDTKSTSFGITAFEGSKYAHMYARFCPDAPTVASRTHGEGIILKYNFTAGKSYTLKFAHRSPLPPTETKILLVTNMPNFGGIPDNGSDCTDNLDIIPAIPSSNQLVGTITPGGSWQTSTLTFTPTSNFNQIWVRPLQNGTIDQGILTSDLLLDDVCVKETCDPDNFNVSLCRYPGATDLVATIGGVSIPQSQWRLWRALDCNGGTNSGNMNGQLPINWLSANSFTIPANSGCYILVYIFHPAGCPEQLVRVLFNTATTDAVQVCSGPCDDWKIDISDELPCKTLFFEVNSGNTPFPPGTVITATVDGVPYTTGTPGIVKYNVQSGESRYIHVCFTVSQPNCPTITQCVDYFIDCKHVSENPTDRSGADHAVSVNKEIVVTNPATGTIHFSRMVEQGQAQLYSVQGALILSNELAQADQLDVTTVTTGQYILVIREAAAITTRLVFINNR